MTKSELLMAIEAQAVERKGRRTMRRDALSELPQEQGFATIVTGVRRCGKSTLLEQWAKGAKGGCTSVLFDDLRLVDFSTEDFQLLGKIFAERKPEAVILDEVQDVAGWERFVDGLLLRGYKVFVTGSNAKLLSRELGTKLTGRHLDLRLNPFSLSEFRRFTKSRKGLGSLKEYLQVGGFPAYVATRNRKVLEELFNDMIYRDVVVRYNLGNAVPIRTLAAYLMKHIGTRLSPSRLNQAIHVQSAKTVLDYFGYLSECCMIGRLEGFAESEKARMLAAKKVYVCDTGLAGIFESDASGNLGHKLENLVYLHLKAKGGDLCYFDSKEGECDFVRRDKGECEAVQVCWELDDDNRKREFDGLVGALDYFGLKRGVIVTADQSDEAVYRGHEIEIISVSELV